LLQPDQVLEAGVVTTQGAATDLYHYWMAWWLIRSRLARQFFLQTKNSNQDRIEWVWNRLPKWGA